MEQTPSCKYYRLLADEYIEGELTGEEMREFEAHIAECPECRKEFEELRALKEMLANSGEEIPEGLHERIMNRVGVEMKPKKNKLRAFRRAAISAACAVICLSLTLIFTIMPLWQEGTGSGLPEDPIADSAAGKTEALPTDTQLSINNESAIDTSIAETNAPDRVEIEDESKATPIEPEMNPAPEGVVESTFAAAESTAAAGTKVPDTHPETIKPETAAPETEAPAVATESPSTEAPAEEAPDASINIEASGVKDSDNTTSLNLNIKSPSAESNSAPGGDEITLALLIVSGLLAVASFIAFLISLSSVRNTPSKKKDEEER